MGKHRQIVRLKCIPQWYEKLEELEQTEFIGRLEAVNGQSLGVEQKCMYV